MAYQDGTFSSAVQNGPAQTFYPFINAATKDNVTKGTVRNYVVLPANYTPAAALSTDPADNTQYLIEESDLSIEAGIARFARTYCKVPAQQIEPGTIVLSKPTVPGNDAFPRNFGSYLVVQPDTTLEEFDAYARKTVTSDSGAPGFYPTGGTYTLTFDGNTTSSLNYSANAATVQSALNGLTTIQNRGNVAVTGSYNSAGGFAVTFNNYATGSINTASIVVATDALLSSSIASSNNGYSQSFQMSVSGTNFSNTSASINQSGLTVTPSSWTIGTQFSYTNSVYGRGWSCGISTHSSATISGTFVINLLGQSTSAITFSYDLATLQANIESALSALSAVSSRGTVRITDMRIFETSSVFWNTYIDPIITGGSFTVSLFSETTSALNYNATAATVQSAINALTNVQLRGNVVVTSSGLTTILNTTNSVASFSVGFSNNSFTSNALALTPTGSTITVSKTDGTIGRTQNVALASGTATRTIYAASHDIDAGETIFLRNSGSVFANIAPSKVTVIDANTIQLSVASSDSWASVSAFTEIGPRTKQGYAPGSVVIRSTSTTDFYLPGVTSGITTASDIPIPVDESSTAAFLQAVFSGQDNINVRVGELRQWRGPILQVDRTSVNSDDV